MFLLFPLCFLFFFNDTATTEIYTLSLHDALPIYLHRRSGRLRRRSVLEDVARGGTGAAQVLSHRSEEHTSELQSQSNLVCRLLLEKKKQKKNITTIRESYDQQKHTLSDTVTTPRQ